MDHKKIAGCLDSVVFLSLCWMIFFLPGSKSLVEIFIGLAFLSWFLKRVIFRCHHEARFFGLRPQNDGKRCHPDPELFGVAQDRLREGEGSKIININMPIIGFIAISFLSVITSTSLVLSMEGFLSKVLKSILLYFVVIETVNDKKRIEWILFVMFFSMTVALIDGLFQFYTGADFLRQFSLWSGTAMRSCFGNPNDFAAWLVVMIPIVLCLAFRRKILWVLAGVSVACLILTYSRGAWISFTISVSIMAVLRNRKLLVLILIAFFVLPFIVPDSVKERAYSIVTTLDTSRLGLWHEALNIIKDHPLF